jgi:hypothetical protein
MLKKIQKRFSNNARKRRGNLFNETLQPNEKDKLLDLGGGNGSHFNQIIDNEKINNVTISDISKSDLSHAQKKFGYRTSLLQESNELPFDDNEFDIVFCNSVIEHVTLPKKDIWTFKNTKEFKKISLQRQAEFSNEIGRISKSYFVQTPYKYFILESHTWLPGIIVFLPRKFQIRVIRTFNRFWPKKTTPDWSLLTYKDMVKLFPDAIVYKEKSFGLTKSLIAIKTKNTSDDRKNDR